jgi:hypothetical protein
MASYFGGPSLIPPPRDPVGQAMDWLAQLRDESPGEAPWEAAYEPPATPPALSEASSVTPVLTRAEFTEQAVIGDGLRLPIAWCEMSACISQHAEPGTLGEADARTRAIAAGWRMDAVGRLVCPQCQRSDSHFWTSRPVARWERSRAMSIAAGMAAAGRRTAVAPPPGRHRDRPGRSGHAR